MLPAISADGRSIISKWQLGGPTDATGINIVVTQIVSLFRDLARIQYTIENQGVSSVIGLRLATDPSDSGALDPFITPVSTTHSEAMPFSQGGTTITIPNAIHDDVSNPVFIPTLGLFGTDTDFRPALPTGIDRRVTPVVPQIPGDWFTYAPAINPLAIWKGVLQPTPATALPGINPGPGIPFARLLNLTDATTPDRFLLAGHAPLITGGVGGDLPALLTSVLGPNAIPGWDFVVDPLHSILGPEAAPSLGDVSEATYWSPRSMASGQRATFVTYIGEGVADHGFAGTAGIPNVPSNPNNQLFVASAESRSDVPTGLPVFGNGVPLVGNKEMPGDHLPADFDMFGFAQNLRSDITIPGVSATIGLPAGLELLPETTPPTLVNTVLLGTLDAWSPGAPFAERETSWSLRATGEQAGILPVTVTMQSTLGSAQVVRAMNIPQGTRYLLPVGHFNMFTFPYTFADPTPSVALNIGAFGPTASVDVLRWDPVAENYVQATALVPGESYWIRLNGPANDQFIDLVGATPVNIPGTGLGPTQGTFTIPLQRGWNQVGNPSPYAVPLQQLRFLDAATGENVDLLTAVRRGFVLGSVWRWDRQAQQYVQIGLNQYVPPGDGIWIFAPRPELLLWPAPLGFGVQVG